MTIESSMTKRFSPRGQLIISDKIQDLFIIIPDPNSPSLLLLKKRAMPKIYTGDKREQEMLKNFVLSQRVRNTNYLYSETATCIDSRE